MVIYPWDFEQFFYPSSDVSVAKMLVGKCGHRDSNSQIVAKKFTVPTYMAPSDFVSLSSLSAFVFRFRVSSLSLNVYWVM